MTPNWSILAGLRFFLCIIVFANHLTDFWHNRVLDVVKNLNGMCAVWAFLMVSGFSIAHSIRRQPSGFYARRFRRIYPTYLMCFGLAVLSLALEHALWGTPENEINPTRASLLSHLVFGQIFYGPTIRTFVPSWSLCVEVVLYATAPIFAICRARNIALLTFVSAVCIASNLFSLPRITNFAHPAIVLYTAWAFLLGWLVAVHPTRTVRVLSFVLPLVVTQFSNSMIGEFGFVPLLLTSWALNYSHKIELSKSWKSALSGLGDLSFPLYLAHFPVITAVVFSGNGSLAAAIVASFVVSGLLLRLDKIKFFESSKSLVKSQLLDSDQASASINRDVDTKNFV